MLASVSEQDTNNFSKVHISSVTFRKAAFIFVEDDDESNVSYNKAS